MRNEEFFQKRRVIGPAIHLITMYWAASKPEKLPWFVVVDGDPLTDEEVAAFLGVSPFTAARWRQPCPTSAVCCGRDSHPSGTLAGWY